jgi:hypothetical protein
MGMIEASNGLGLAHKAGGEALFVGVVGRQHLNRHVAVKSRLVRLVDSCHAAFADLLNDLILSQRVPNQTVQA